MWRSEGSAPIKADDFLPKKPLTEEEIENEAIAFFENLSNLSALEQKIKKSLQ
jgi:hypothetical protein